MNTNHIVIDNGSTTIKAGFSGQDAPTARFPSVVGKRKYQTMNILQQYIGQEAIQKVGVLKLQYPIQHGIVENWDQMTQIWQHCFYNELQIDPKEHAVMMTEVSRNPIQNSKKLTEIMFETFKVPSFYLSYTAPLSLYASGRTTGTVLQSGGEVTQVNSLFQAQLISYAVERYNFAGENLTTYMGQILNEVGLYYNNTSAERQIVKRIKEQLCYVSTCSVPKVEQNQKSPDCSKNYQLPDGSTITIGSQRWRCPQILFDPQIVGKEIPSLPQMTINCISGCKSDIRKQLYGNIVLSGGNTFINGFEDRVYREIKNNVSSELENVVKVIACPERKFLTWIGGQILSSLSTFQDRWISKGSYDEMGGQIVIKKCYRNQCL